MINMKEKDNRIIIDLNINNLKDVLELSYKELGDYLTEKALLQCITDENKFCKVISDEENNFIGFIEYVLLTSDTVEDYLKIPSLRKDDNWFNCQKIGFLETMAIDKDRKRTGAGRRLLMVAMEDLINRGAKVMCGVAWKDFNGVTNMKKLFTEFGFEERLEISGYWNQWSENTRGFICPACGEPPCKCSGVVWAKQIIQEVN